MMTPGKDGDICRVGAIRDLSFDSRDQTGPFIIGPLIFVERHLCRCWRMVRAQCLVDF